MNVLDNQIKCLEFIWHGISHQKRNPLGVTPAMLAIEKATTHKSKENEYP